MTKQVIWKIVQEDNTYSMQHDMFVGFREACYVIEMNICHVYQLKRMWYSCNMICCGIIKDHVFACCGNFFKVVLCLCYIKRCCLPHFAISFHLGSFLMLKNVGDLVRNFLTQTFASSHVCCSSFSMNPIGND